MVGLNVEISMRCMIVLGAVLVPFSMATADSRPELCHFAFDDFYTSLLTQTEDLPVESVVAEYEESEGFLACARSFHFVVTSGMV